MQMFCIFCTGCVLSVFIVIPSVPPVAAVAVTGTEMRKAQPHVIPNASTLKKDGTQHLDCAVWRLPTLGARHALYSILRGKNICRVSEPCCYNSVPKLVSLILVTVAPIPYSLAGIYHYAQGVYSESYTVLE
jgi:hypothetical protein